MSEIFYSILVSLYHSRAQKSRALKKLTEITSHIQNQIPVPKLEGTKQVSFELRSEEIYDTKPKPLKCQTPTPKISAKQLESHDTFEHVEQVTLLTSYQKQAHEFHKHLVHTDPLM